MYSKVLGMLAVLVLQSNAFANQPAFDAGYYEIQSIQTEEIQDLTTGDVGSPPIGLLDCSRRAINGKPDVPMNPIDEVGIIVDKIINIGKKIWAIVEAGKPVVNFENDVATALPEGVHCWNDLENWQMPKSKIYSVSMRNAYNVEVVKFNYRINYLAGGSADGVGKYIGYATAIPKDLYVAWGYRFDAKASVPTVFNLGSRKEPLAGMQLTMQYTVSTVMNHVEQSQAYVIDGLGTFTQLE